MVGCAVAGCLAGFAECARAYAHMHSYKGANLTLLPQDAGDESPACLDGSPYGFYFSPSSNSSNKRWTISIEVCL